jgi:hypothetical protein
VAYSARAPRGNRDSLSAAYPQHIHRADSRGCVSVHVGLLRNRSQARNPPAGRSSLNPNDASESASLTGVKRLQLGNTIVGAAEPPAKLAADVLHHHHIGMDIRLVTRVELFGRELVQQGWALRDDGR